MKKIYTTLLALILFGQYAIGQHLVSAEYKGSKTQSDLIFQFFNPDFKNGVDYYKVVYETKDLDGQATQVSGLMVIPDNLDKKYPLACYQHGTSSSDDDVPSRLNQESNLPIALGGMGYVVVAPDYLGLGDSPGVHPYVHAASEAWVAVDFFRAAKEYAADNDVFLNEQVFVTGYSQGGHSAMALHRMLEQELSDEFQVAAAAPMSGPYSVSGVMNDLITSGEVYGFPGYLINTFISYQEVYGNIYGSIEEAFKAPYVPVIQQFANDEIGLGEMNSALIGLLNANENAVVPLKLLTDGFANAILSQPDHPANVATAANDTYEWAPNAPTRLYYCMADEQVPFENSTLAETTMSDLGTADVQAIDVNSNAGHAGCVLPAVLKVIDFFNGIQVLEDAPVATRKVIASALGLYPNPATDQVFLKNFPADGELRLFDMNGKMKMATTIQKGDNQLFLNELNKGMYIIEIIGTDKIWTDKLMVD